jgi:hypothetical protein
VKGEDPSAPGIWVQPVGESGVRSSGLIGEGEWSPPSGDVFGKPFDVAGGLWFDADEWNAFGLRFDDPGCLLIDVQQVIDPPVGRDQDEHTDGYPK